MFLLLCLQAGFPESQFLKKETVSSRFDVSGVLLSLYLKSKCYSVTCAY